ncbi:hypothetical protein HHI36_016197 [Cryptolaemus montrouzieri]|uniref:Sec16 Sec23-binding domain-containing protein n=1 Tax=Cryptolaemus montrouzieri TaxID=559131 RepID=A0ABD2NJT5_9CUCU
MSWLKRRSQNNTPSPAPTAHPTDPVPMYNPNQANQWQPNNWYQQQQQQQQQHQQQQQQHAPGQHQQGYWEQSVYTDQPNQQLYQNAQQFQRYQNQNTMYENTVHQQQPNQQTYGNLQYSQQYNTQNNSLQTVPLQQTETDTWGNWGWGDEDNSNVQNTQSVQPKQQVKSGNELSSNLANDESWNWSVEEPGNQLKENIRDDIPAKDSMDLFPKMGKLATMGAGDQGNADEIIGSLPPPAATGRRNKLETPQWSMDSQLSQESSDDILQTSESDNHLVSSSTVSHSPLSGLDNLHPMKEDLTTDNVLNPIYQHIENREIIRNDHDQDLNQSQLSTRPPSFPPVGSAFVASQEDPKMPYNRASNSSHKNPISAVPTTQFSARQNAYAPSFAQSVNLETVPDNSEHPDVASSNSSGKLSGLSSPPQRTNQLQNWQDNNEAPMNDRNQYLETGQLSDANQHSFSANVEPESMGLLTNQEDTLPPPGLRRMVLGQIEQQESSGNLENFSDEPPPGLSRMVLGQNESNSNPSTVENDVSNSFEPLSPPEGLRRMVPGESSSPENSLRQPTFQSENPNIDDSDLEFNQVPQLRSATIGADTPPASSIPVTTQSNLSSSNRSETIGAADSSEKSRGSSISPANARKSTRKPMDKKFDGHRSEFIEGQTVESGMSSVVAGIRNLAVGENSTDENNEISSKSEPRRKLSRQDTSESENDKRGKSPRERKDRRFKGDRRERDHFSPDLTRDRRSDRRKYKDRHYSKDDDGDYFSDGDRDNTNKDRDHDKKYYSLRKDKDRDRRRRESPREYEKERRKRDDYYHHRYDSYENEERSRPSSRSDSMHDSMYRGDRRLDKDMRDRKRDRPRDRDKHRRSRDSYNPYAQGYASFDPYNPYYQQYQYQYYENLRRTNPQAYAEIYRKYYQQHSSRHPPMYGADDRSSVHSGRSSANEELTKDSFVRQKDHTDSYILEDATNKLGRVTPAKFITAHTKASIATGRMVKILPNYPQDGQLALVELVSLETYLQKDDEYKELANYPGPLIKAVTHKKTVIEYCESKVRNAGSNLDICDADSYILMWDFLILLLRQNGKVVGTDIAELLLKSRTTEFPVRPSSALSNLSANTGDIAPISESSNPQLSEGLNGFSISTLKEEEVTNKFREYLLYGSDQEALEWAMKHGLWGHALFLASKLGKRVYSNVMVRFANGLTLNDPLQTLYQLLSGRMPAAVTSVADEKWGDWKPHLAMILSNSSLQPELNRKAITALGDTLMVRGSLYAAQFCYLMAEVGFGRYGSDNAKVVLLGSNHNKPFAHFATNEAIHMTEIYEYACSLNDPEFALPELQAYKYLLATRLADRGLLEKSLAYLEKIALYITANPSQVQCSLVNNVWNLADRLKYYDPLVAVDDDENCDNGLDNKSDNLWLKNLKMVQNDINAGLITSVDNYTNNDLTLVDQNQSMLDPNQQEAWQHSQPSYGTQYQSDASQLHWQPEQLIQLQPPQDNHQQADMQPEGYPSLYQEQQQYWPSQQQQQQQQQWDLPSVQSNTETFDQDQQNYYGSTNTQNEDHERPQISMPNQQSKGKSIFDDEPLPHEKNQKVKEPPAKTDGSNQQKQNSSGWFGGIFSRLALKPKNQMKLPDDKNPTIVWDQEKKRWVNLDEDNNVSTNDVKPPPKLTDMKPVTAKPPLPQGTINNNLMNTTQGYANPASFNDSRNAMNVSTQPGQVPLVDSSVQQMQGVPENTQGNIFKLQKSRNLKKSYIDVFNPGGVAKAAPAPNVAGFPTTNAIPQMNFFVPQPVNDPNVPTNFLTQGTQVIQPQHDDSAQGHH